MLSDIGSWASIIGLILTLVTLVITSKVNQKVNGALKSRTDKSYFIKRATGVVNNLKEVKKMAEEDANDILYSTKHYSQINSAINLVEASWEILLPYERKATKKRKIEKWTVKFKRVKEIYSMKYHTNNKELVAFLDELITFLEKEINSNE